MARNGLAVGVAVSWGPAVAAREDDNLSLIQYDASLGKGMYVWFCNFFCFAMWHAMGLVANDCNTKADLKADTTAGAGDGLCVWAES